MHGAPGTGSVVHKLEIAVPGEKVERSVTEVERSSRYGGVCESVQEPLRQEGDENLDGGTGRGRENDHSVQVETGRNCDDHSHNWYGRVLTKCRAMKKRQFYEYIVVERCVEDLSGTVCSVYE